jgi:hypothetical protein
MEELDEIDVRRNIFLDEAKALYKNAKSQTDVAKSLAISLKKALGGIVGDNVSIGATMSSVVVKLHNIDQRPTTYEFHVNDAKRGGFMYAPSITLDTIIAENKEHYRLKVPNLNLQSAAGMMMHYATQPSNGNPANTNMNYRSFGLMMVARKEKPVLINTTVEAAEAIKLALSVTTNAHKHVMTAALAKAFNSGLKDGQWGIRNHIMNDVNALVFEGRDQHFGHNTPPPKTPFEGAEMENALHRAVSAITNKIYDVRSAANAAYLIKYPKNKHYVRDEVLERYPELDDLKPVSDNDVASAIKRYKGAASDGTHSVTLLDKLSPDEMKYQQENGNSTAKHLISSMYVHGFRVAEENNNRSVIRTMRDTILKYMGSGFSVSNGEAILKDMQKSPYLDFCISQAKDKFDFATPETLEQLRETLHKNQGKKFTQAELLERTNKLLDKIRERESDPKYQASKREEERALFDAAERFLGGNSRDLFDFKKALILIEASQQGDNAPSNDERDISDSIKMSLSMHGEMVPEGILTPDIESIFKQTTRNGDFALLGEEHTPRTELSGIKNIGADVEVDAEELENTQPGIKR